MAGRDVYDYSKTEREILELRHARRTELRREVLKILHNPYRHAFGGGGHLEDPAIERFIAARHTAANFARPTWKNGLFFLAFYVFPVFGIYHMLEWDRGHREHLMRTGQVSYADREHKVI